MTDDDLPAAELVAIAMEVLEAENAPQLADHLGLTRRNQDKTVRRWIDGVNEPSYTHTLMLLTEVGLLPKTLPARAAGRPFGEGANEPIRSQERALDEAELAAAIHEIADVLDRLRTLAAAQEQPPPKRQQNG